MKERMKRLYYLGAFALFLALLVSFSPISSNSSYAHTTHAIVATAGSTGHTTGAANVRTGPSTSYGIATVYASGTSVTIYATVTGQVVWGGISTWYRVSDLSSSPLYIYGGLVAVDSSNSNNGNTNTNNNGGNSNTGGTNNNNNGGTNTNNNGGNTGTTTTTTESGVTNGWTNVRTAPNTGASIATVYAPGASITIYATVTGQAVWGPSDWYRVSSLSSSPLYVYSGLVNKVSNSNSNPNTNTNTGNNNPGAPTTQGKLIVVSLSKQWLYAYDNGQEVLNTPITSGRLALQTPTGTFPILAKLHPTTFFSPWPQGSPYWYPPTHIEYALELTTYGIFLHDSYWRSVYGPGTNVWHYDPASGWLDGTHGCVTMPLSAIQWLYNWSSIGTVVQINP